MPSAIRDGQEVAEAPSTVGDNEGSDMEESNHDASEGQENDDQEVAEASSTAGDNEDQQAAEASGSAGDNQGSDNEVSTQDACRGQENDDDVSLSESLKSFFSYSSAPSPSPSPSPPPLPPSASSSSSTSSPPSKSRNIIKPNQHENVSVEVEFLTYVKGDGVCQRHLGEFYEALKYECNLFDVDVVFRATEGDVRKTFSTQPIENGDYWYELQWDELWQMIRCCGCDRTVIAENKEYKDMIFPPLQNWSISIVPTISGVVTDVARKAEARTRSEMESPVRDNVLNSYERKDVNGFGCEGAGQESSVEANVDVGGAGAETDAQKAMMNADGAMEAEAATRSETKSGGVCENVSNSSERKDFNDAAAEGAGQKMSVVENVAVGGAGAETDAQKAMMNVDSNTMEETSTDTRGAKDGNGSYKGPLQVAPILLASSKEAKAVALCEFFNRGGKGGFEYIYFSYGEGQIYTYLAELKNKSLSSVIEKCLER